MGNFVVKLTENKTLLIMFRMSVIVCSFFVFFVGFLGRIIIDDIHDIQKVQQAMIQQMASLQTMETIDHENLMRVSETLYGRRK